VQGFSAAAILRAAIRPVPNQQLRDRTSKRRRSHVQSRVARVKVVRDVAKKEVSCPLAGRANALPCRGKRRSYRQTAGYLLDLATHDNSNKIKKRRLHPAIFENLL
jgi:hypothetical protein